MRGRYRSRYGTRRARDGGKQRAMEHIEAARRLSQRLGGADEHVKSYFFELSSARLRSILNDYEAKYGAAARQYAEETIPKWRIGQVHMSGMVAERLFDLLPPRMPALERLSLTEILWNHFGPRTNFALQIGVDADINTVIKLIEEHVVEAIQEHVVPQAMESQFRWLSGGDVKIKQTLLNHIRQLERNLVVQFAKRKIPILLDHMRSSDGSLTGYSKQEFSIGNHTIKIFIDKNSRGIKKVEPAHAGFSSRTSRQQLNYPIWFLVIAAAFIGLLILAR